MSFITINMSKITLVAGTRTDLYRRPGKAYANAPVHVVPTPEGEFSATVRVRMPVARVEYHQAGILFATSAEALGRNDDWIKAGVEFWGGRVRASVVVTRGIAGSDWSVGDFDAFALEDADAGGDFVAFRVRLSRAADGTIVVEMEDKESEWVLVRKSYGWGNAVACVGVMCAAPGDGAGLETVFDDFQVSR
ncbi:hypothetical protein HDU83_006634 [Entophlyctis luteolus]|nr:hypothetical protein HDU83_006634 [Entophlyctis luteolus]KAJ3391725.1 hypothetical protein HDU84_005487 [Entophlyctis sp. JEL0112]